MTDPIERMEMLEAMVRDLSSDYDACRCRLEAALYDLEVARSRVGASARGYAEFQIL